MRKKLTMEIGKLMDKDTSNVIDASYKKFEEAWNKFEGRAFLLGCEEVVIRKISMDCKFQYCCATNVAKESFGYHYYLLMRDLAMM